MRGLAALAVVALLASAPAALGSSGGDSIVGGSPATPGDYPAQGFLTIDLDSNPNTFEAFCGGTLLGSTWFLTAAHCAYDGTPLASSRLRVRLGSVNWPSATDIYAVTAVDVDQAYSEATHANDLAMLRLQRPAPYPPARVVRLDEGARWASGTTARIVGWGATSSNGQNPSTSLLQADVPIRPDAVCSDPSSYGGDFDPSTMVCAGNGTADTCAGDSGGPLMVRDGADWVLVGVTSWGLGCNDLQFPGVYARLGAPALNRWVMDRHPRASFTAGPANTNQPTTFTSTSFYPPGAGSFTRFNWDLDGDGQFDDGSGAGAKWTFPTRGAHDVGLEALAPNGDRAVTRQVLGVNGSPAAVAGRYTVGEGRTVAMTGSGSDPEGNTLTYAWDLDRNGSFESAGRSATFSTLGIDGPATRAPLLRVCDSAGACSDDPATVRIVNVAPRANAGPDRRVRRNRRVRFFVRATDPGGDALTATWRIGRRTVKGSRVTHVFRRAGRYTVRVTVTDGDGGSTTDVVRVRVRR
ncbi:MAG TPA: trypsin-like serine protease [Gaiellaceae bacterium]|nr:trypsin-like serine protease [Gaiellaceae bacterium]